MSTTMASLDDTTETSFFRDVTSEATTEFPLFNMTHFLMRKLENDSHFMHCPSAGPNNLGRYISMILYTVVCIIGLFGNSLVI